VAGAAPRSKLDKAKRLKIEILDELALEKLLSS
jgi:NAD-dependent DNA ligase